MLDSDLLAVIETGDADALDRVFELLYKDLRRLAASYLKGERAGYSLQPTELVHEVWVRLATGVGVGRARTRVQFLALAASAMRRALVDRARHHGRARRGGPGVVHMTLDPEAGPAIGGESGEVDVLALNAAIERLSRLHERQARVVELRAFAGMTIAEVAEVLAVSTDTVEDDWTMARTWLWHELRRPV